jgi:transcriptional regulator with XRE-family HTH domain
MNHIRATSTTGEILQEIGRRVRAYRLQQNKTHAELAKEAGISRATLVRAEAGQNSSLESLVKILRVLGRLDALNDFLAPTLISPIQLAASQGRTRRRARKTTKGLDERELRSCIVEPDDLEVPNR